MAGEMKARRVPAFIVAGTSSGAGKTLVTLAVMEAFRRRGLVVQSFKAGPDYIDPGLHSRLLKRPSYNLDTWMMGVKGVRRTFNCAAADSDCAIIEGVMGLFDGRGGRAQEGSTAHLSKALGIPVILVADAARAARSMGAVVKGFETFDGEVDLRWVIFNRVASERHEKILRDSVKGSKVRVLGCVPKDPALVLEERHLGLATAGDIAVQRWDAMISKAADMIESSIDLDALLRTKTTLDAKAAREPRAPSVRVAYALDRAFSFYYQENLDILSSLGAELVPFSPLADKALPDGAQAVYIGGGYPELHAKTLEGNKGLLDGLRRAAEQGMPIYAECGGLMYLGKAIEQGGDSSAMTGVFPWTTRLLTKRKALGYREVFLTENCPFLKKGKLRGHEFHYSEMSGRTGRRMAYRVSGIESAGEGFVYKNTLASYIHLHFASNPAFAAGFLKTAVDNRLR